MERYNNRHRYAGSFKDFMATQIFTKSKSISNMGPLCRAVFEYIARKPLTMEFGGRSAHTEWINTSGEVRRMPQAKRACNETHLNVRRSHVVGGWLRSPSMGLSIFLLMLRSPTSYCAREQEWTGG